MRIRNLDIFEIKKDVFKHLSKLGIDKDEILIDDTKHQNYYHPGKFQVQFF